MYVRYEPLLIAEAGIDVTLIHAGRSSQDMHAVYQRAMLRDQTLEVMTALNSVRETLFRLAKENRDTIAPCYTNGWRRSRIRSGTPGSDTLKVSGATSSRLRNSGPV